jgi:hypothetical protein
MFEAQLRDVTIWEHEEFSGRVLFRTEVSAGEHGIEIRSTRSENGITMWTPTTMLSFADLEDIATRARHYETCSCPTHEAWRDQTTRR